MKLIEVNMSDRLTDVINNSLFSERLYNCLITDGNEISYGSWNSKFMKNGMIKIIKSLGIYKVTGARDTKKTFIHPKLKLIIDTSSPDQKNVALTIINMVEGNYVGIDDFKDLDLTNFNKLPNNDVFASKYGYSTYVIYNELNNLFKIGRTKDISKRIYGLKQEHGDKLSLIGFKSGDVESELHELLKENRLFGEWFNCSFDSILDVMNEYNFDFKK